MSLPRLKPGTPVRIAFTKPYCEQFPHYAGMWQGKTGRIVKLGKELTRETYVSVIVDGHELCIEREHIRALSQVIR